MAKFLAADSLPAWFPLHHFNEPKFNYKTGVELVAADKISLWAFVAMVAFNPIFWNIVARNEYRNKTITKVVGSPYVGCYILALTIFSLSAFRDHLFVNAIKDQPALAILSRDAVKFAAVALFVIGQVFVISSMWALGVTGTYLGDYFGILMSHRVTGFPFNVLNDPMYIGSFITHVGTSLWFQSPVGLALSFWVLVVYLVALKFEGPFTDKIYAAKAKKTDAITEDDKPTVLSTPATPSRKSSRLARKSEIGSASAGSDSDASVPAAVRTAATPRRSTRTPRRSAASGAESTPARVTRSRSRALGSDAE